jgi:hypothetical protein
LVASASTETLLVCAAVPAVDSAAHLAVCPPCSNSWCHTGHPLPSRSARTHRRYAPAQSIRTIRLSIQCADRLHAHERWRVAAAAALSVLGGRVRTSISAPQPSGQTGMRELVVQLPARQGVSVRHPSFEAGGYTLLDHCVSILLLWAVRPERVADQSHRRVQLHPDAVVLVADELEPAAE